VPYNAAMTSDADEEDEWGLDLRKQFELDGWLAIDPETGELSGVPRGPARVLKDFLVVHNEGGQTSTVHSIPIEPCKYALLDEDNRLFLGDVRATEEDPPEDSETVELTEGLDGEANRFEFSPDGTTLAFGVNAASQGTLFVRNMGALTSEQLDLGDGESDAAQVHELAWSDDGTHLSVVWTSVAEESFFQDFRFDAQSGTPSNGAVFKLPLWSYQLHWLQQEPCYFGDIPDNEGLYCHEVSDEGVVSAGNRQGILGTIGDLSGARVLDIGERAVISIPRRSGVSDIKYGSYFFSDAVRGLDLEYGIIAPSLDQLGFYSSTERGEPAGLLFDYDIEISDGPVLNRGKIPAVGYTAELEHCSRVKGWSRSGKKLVCADDTLENIADGRKLWVTTLNSDFESVAQKQIQDFTEGDPFTGRTLFSADDRWLAFDSSEGLVVVDTAAETLEARLLAKEGGERSFRALDAGRWLWQVDTKLFLVDGSLSGDPTETLLSAPLTALAMPSTCHPEQYIQSPLEWCGGYAGNDQFVVAGDYSAVVFPTTGGGLYALRLPADPTASVGTATRVSDVNVTCPDDGCSATLKFQN